MAQPPVARNVQTQGQISVETPGIIHETLFAQEAVKQLHSDDFTTDKKELIAMRYKDCLIVLFYGRNIESDQLVRVFADAAREATGPVFAAVNLFVERRVAEAFNKINTEPGHPFNWAAMKGYPFILVYQNGWPKAAYNGPRETQSLIDYSLTLACRADYYETHIISSGVQIANRVAMGPYNRNYGPDGKILKPITSSEDFKIDAPTRGFNPNLSLVQPGTAAANQQANVIQREVQGLQQGATSLTQTPTTPPVVTVPVQQT